MTGFTKKPAKDNQICKEHIEEGQGPVLLAEALSANTKKLLRKKQSLHYPQDNIFFVRALLKTDGESFLVRWANFPVDEATWEQKTVLPGFIVEWYEEDLSRLGQVIPPPTIKWSKVFIHTYVEVLTFLLIF